MKEKEQFEDFDDLKVTKKPKKEKDKKGKVKQEEEKDKQLKKKNDQRYKKLLRRIAETLNKNNPDLASDKTKITIIPPKVSKQGTKKTAISNFQAICKQLDRNPQHVMNFFLEDLGGSSGSLGNQGFVIKNVLTQKNVQNLFKKYITEFVQCQLCRRQNTELIKDDKMRLWTIHCNSCKSNRSVRTIKGAEKKYESAEVNEKKEEKQ